MKSEVVREWTRLIPYPFCETLAALKSCGGDQPLIDELERLNRKEKTMSEKLTPSQRELLTAMLAYHHRAFVPIAGSKVARPLALRGLLELDAEQKRARLTRAGRGAVRA
jgi:hypothetical protein